MATRAHVLPRLGGDFVRPKPWMRPPIATRVTWVDLVLIFIFMAGLYTNYTIMLSQKLPFPSAPAGVAGLILLWRRRDDITPRALVGFFAILALFLVSILLAPNINWLARRTNGLIQLTYSLVIGYALFLTVKRAERRQIARLFLAFALLILVGCLLETYGGLRPISDAVRNGRSTTRASTRTTCATSCSTIACGRSSSRPSPPASPSATRCSASSGWSPASGAGSCRSISSWSASACAPCLGRRCC